MLDDIQAEVARYREQIRRTNRMTLSPHSRYMQRWDVITTVALLFTATVTPFEVGIMEPSTLSQMAVDPLAWINRVVDCIFLTDIVLNCFLSYQELGEHGGAWIHDNQKIFLRYLRSYFFLDLLTALPMDVIVQGAIEMGSGGGTGDRAGIQEIAASEQPPPAFRLIRMLRLVKLGRIVRLQRIFRRWQAFWGISFGLIALIQFAVLIVIMAHWLACVWVLIGCNNAYVVPAWRQTKTRGSLTRTQLSRVIDLQHRSTPPLPRKSMASRCTPRCRASSPADQALCRPLPRQNITQSFMVIVGSSVWAYVLSSGCGIIATLNPNGVIIGI